MLLGGVRAAYSFNVPHTPQPRGIGEGVVVDLFDAKITYGDVPTAELLRSLAVLKATQFKSLVNYGPYLFQAAQHIPGVKSVANAVAKRTFFRQFCGGETMEECRSFTTRLQKKGIACIFDYSAEALPGYENVHSSEKFDASVAIIRDTVKWSAENEVPGFSCVKISGVARFTLLEKVTELIYDGNMTENLRKYIGAVQRGELPGATAEESAEFFESLDRLDSLCSEASELGVPMLIDAEQYSIQGAIDLFAMVMQLHYNKTEARVYTTIQAYLKNAQSRVECLKSMSEENGFVYGVKQVRGAYMVSERKRANELGYKSPICDTAEDTHRNYDTLGASMLEDVVNNRGAVMFATHNVHSLKTIAHECARIGVDRASPNLHIAQLYGMGDSLTMGMVKAGYNAAKYVPFGPIEEVMPYLTRRLQENNDALSGAPRDIRLFMEVLKERDLLPRL